MIILLTRYAIFTKPYVILTKAKFSTIATQFSFSFGSCNHILFIHHSLHGSIFSLLYVDVMIINGNNLQAITELKNYLSQKLKIKNLGRLTYYIGQEVTSNGSSYFLSQVKICCKFSISNKAHKCLSYFNSS